MIYEIVFPGAERPQSPCTLIPYAPSQYWSKCGAKIHRKLQRPLESGSPKLVQSTGNFELVLGVERVLHQEYFQILLGRLFWMSRSQCSPHAARHLGEHDLPSVLDLDLPPEILELEEIALREVPSMINELLVRSRIPANLQPHQYEIHALVRTVFEDGFELLLQRYASRSASSISRDSTSSTLSDRPNGYSSPDSGSGTSHRHNDASQIFRSSEAGSSSAVPEASNWAPEQFSQGLGVGTDADYSYPLNGFDIPMDWNFDESWHNSGTL